MSEVKTDYQQTYMFHEGAKPRNARKPLPRLRNPNPPPMDFRTVQRLDFIERKPDPQGICKVYGFTAGRYLSEIGFYNPEGA